MKILIKVTKEILEKSKMCGFVVGACIYENCAVALAVRDIFPEARVGGDQIRPFRRKDYRINLPEKASKFIRQFDISYSEERVNMEPINFEIDVPHYIINRIGINEVYKVLSESKTLEMVMP